MTETASTDPAPETSELDPIHDPLAQPVVPSPGLAYDPPTVVPNVHAHAVSGLDHEPIGANAVAAYEENVALAAAGEPVTQPDEPGKVIEVPAGDLDSRLTWVSEGDTQDARSARADALYQGEKDAGASDQDLADLGPRLVAAVYPNPEHTEPDGS